MITEPEELQTPNVELAKKIKQEILYLEPDKNPKHRKRYCDARKRFIGHLEDQKKPNGTPWAYDDKTGKTMKPGMKAKENVTVGIGFNMDAGRSAKIEWNQAFGSLPEQERPSFDAIYKGEKPLEQKHIDMLFHVCIQNREKYLLKTYSRNWERFKPNECLAIESMNFNSRAKEYKIEDSEGKIIKDVQNTLVGNKTNFFEQLNLHYDKKRTDYIGDEEALNMACWEIRMGSNSEKSRGLQDRRNAEELMFSSSFMGLRMPKEKRDKHREEIISKLRSLSYGTLPIDRMFSMLREAMMQAYKKGTTHTMHFMIGPNEDDYSKIDAAVEMELSNYLRSFADEYSKIFQFVNKKLNSFVSDAYTVDHMNNLPQHKAEVITECSARLQKRYDDIQEKFQKYLEKIKGDEC